MTKRKHFKVEVLLDNEWVNYGFHLNEENAHINAEVYSKSKQTFARIIHEGRIEKEYGYEKI